MGLFYCLLAGISTGAARGGNGNTWPLYYEWALSSHVVEYASTVFEYKRH